MTLALSLAHAYLVYPAIAILLGAGRCCSVCDSLPAVSVLVPAHNEASVIAEKIDNLLTLDYPPEQIELIILDDGSTDQTAEVVQSKLLKGIRLIQVDSRNGKASSMNRLAQEARHPLLLFSDANVMFSLNAVRRLVDSIANDNVGAVTGEVRLEGSDQEFGVGEALYYWMERRIQSAESRIGSVMGVDGGMFLLRRELYEPIPIDTILDDFLISTNVMRLGKRVIYEASAKATESGTPSSKQESTRRVRIAAGAVQLLRRGNVPHISQPVLWFQFVSHKLLRWVSPFLFIALFVCSTILARNNSFYMAAFVIQTLAGLWFLLTWICRPVRKTSLGSIGFYFFISQVAMVAGTVKGIFNLQPPQWKKGGR